jgi:hypothetical protein
MTDLFAHAASKPYTSILLFRNNKIQIQIDAILLKRDVLKHTPVNHLVLAQEETEEEGNNGEDNSMYESSNIRGRTTVLVILQSKQPFPFALWRKCEKHTRTQYKEEECSSPGTG